MSRKAFVIAGLMVGGLFAVHAFAAQGPKDFKGDAFEAPFVNGTNVLQAGSEGKISTLGEWKVEIEGVAAGTYFICLESSNQSAYLIGVKTLAATGELKVICDIDTGCLETGTPPVAGQVRQIADNTYAAPFLSVRQTDCAGTLNYKSGFQVN